MPENLRVKARPELFVDMNRLPKDQIDIREGIRSLPAMLKGYVRAGCCIGEGAVVDRQFGTTDVFIYFPVSGLDPRYKSRFGLSK
jgi:putative hemolysin